MLATTRVDQELSSAHIAQEEARPGGIFWLQSPVARLRAVWRCRG